MKTFSHCSTNGFSATEIQDDCISLKTTNGNETFCEAKLNFESFVLNEIGEECLG
jgi:hypothetical protein